MQTFVLAYAKKTGLLMTRPTERAHSGVLLIRVKLIVYMHFSFELMGHVKVKYLSAFKQHGIFETRQKFGMSYAICIMT